MPFLCHGQFQLCFSVLSNKTEHSFRHYPLAKTNVLYCATSIELRYPNLILYEVYKSLGYVRLKLKRKNRHNSKVVFRPCECLVLAGKNGLVRNYFLVFSEAVVVYRKPSYDLGPEQYSRRPRSSLEVASSFYWSVLGHEKWSLSHKWW